MGKSWFFDALDARSGRAFVSLRSGDLDHVSNLDNFVQSYFISAPKFEPEPLSGSGLGLAAGRGVFQEGLYDEDGEVPFPSLASVVDFVKRSYLSGGGGSGPEREGPPEPPEEGPTGEGPFSIYQVETEVSEVRAGDQLTAQTAFRASSLLKFIKDVPNKINSSQRGHPAPLEFSSTDNISASHSGSDVSVSVRITRAICVLWLEVLSRAPIGDAGTEKWTRWQNSVRVLEVVFESFRLGEFLQVDEIARKVRTKTQDNTKRFLSNSLRGVPFPLDETWHLLRDAWDWEEFVPIHEPELSHLHWLGPSNNYLIWHFGHEVFGFPSRENLERLPRREFHKLMRYRDRYYPWVHFSGNWNSSREFTYLDLEAMPVPQMLSKGLDFGELGPQKATLFNFMNVCCASPGEVFSGGHDLVDEARFDLLLLISCLVVDEPSRKRNGSALRFPTAPKRIIQREIERQHSELASLALDWLPDNLPKYLFSAEIENMLIEARSVAYA